MELNILNKFVPIIVYMLERSLDFNLKTMLFCSFLLEYYSFFVRFWSEFELYLIYVENFNFHTVYIKRCIRFVEECMVEKRGNECWYLLDVYYEILSEPRVNICSILFEIDKYAVFGLSVVYLRYIIH